ncbi:MAG: hypothetical protein AAF849_14970 [Bacteroidota bacterium]
MKFLYRFTLIFLLICAVLQMPSAQNSTLLHLNKSFYVTGEVLWYKFYLPKAYEQKAVTLEVVISDDKGAVVSRYFLQNEGKSYVSSYYKIPFDLKSAWYRLSIFPTGNLKDLESKEIIAIKEQLPDLPSENTDVVLSSITFPIYNDLAAIDQIIADDFSGQPNSDLEDLQIEIQLNQSNYSPREQVFVEVSVKDKSGNPLASDISVSVSDSRLIENSLIKKEKLAAFLGNEIAVRGTFKNENGQAVRASVLGMYSSLEDRIFYSSADENGQFAFKPPLFYGERPVQFIGYQFEHMEVSIDLKKRQLPPIEQALIYTEKIKEYIALSRQRKKIFQLYKSLESQIEPAEIELDVLDLEPSATYIIDEYESFEFMYDFFGELLTPLKFFLQKDSTYRASIYNPTGRRSANTELSGTPLFIIDGKLTRDADFVARMDMDYIQKVELMYKTDNLRKKLKAIGRSGVAKITTNLRDVPMAEKDAEDLFTINGLQTKADFPTFDANKISVSQPFFRPQLYWNPGLQSDKNGKANFSFYQSDDVSPFVIRVVVQGENDAFGYTEKVYEVKAKK